MTWTVSLYVWLSIYWYENWFVFFFFHHKWIVFLCILFGSFSQLPDIDWQMPGISDEMYVLAAKLIHRMDLMDERDGLLYPSVLVFLPGIYEIGRLRTALTDLDK